MNLLPSSLLALLLGMSTSGLLRAADTIELKPQWMAGKKYYQTIETDQQSSFSLGPQKLEQKTGITMELTATVSPKQEGKPKRMTIRYERVAMQMDMNGQKMGFDSAKPNEGTDPLGLSKSIGGTVGQDLKVVFDEKDEIADIENYDDFIKRLPQSTVPGFDPKKVFSRESLTQMLKQGGLQANPGKPVAAGDSWPFQTQISLAQVGKITMKGTYTLKSVGDHNGVKSAEIATDGTLSMDMTAADGGDPQATALGMKITGGSLKGTIWFDLGLGFPRESILNQDMTMSMKNPADASQTIEVPMKQNTTVTLTKVEDAK